jgi:hypothetical protein
VERTGSLERYWRSQGTCASRVVLGRAEKAVAHSGPKPPTKTAVKEGSL